MSNNGPMDFFSVDVCDGSMSTKATTIKVDQEVLQNCHRSNGITKPHPHDVLAGRGNSINMHPGNLYFRSVVKHLKNEYVITPKNEKPVFAKVIFEHIRSLDPPGRFLKKDGNEWVDIGMKKALDKTRQALREDADKVLKEIESGVRKVETVSRDL